MRNRLLALTGAALLILTACDKEKEKETEQVFPVQLAKAETGDIQRVVAADAVVFPKTQSAIMPKISAPVRSFKVNRGDHVSAGQLVAELENKDLTAATLDTKGAMDQAQAQYNTVSGATVPEEVTKAQQDLQAAQQAMEAARRVYESRQELLKQGAIARKLVDDANVAYVQAQSQYNVARQHVTAVNSVNKEQEIKSAQGQLNSAKGKHQGAEVQLSYAEVRSPIAGVVADRPLYPGEMATPGTPLMVVMDISIVVARANVPVAQAALLKVGGSATISQTDTGIELPGKITVVSPAVDPATTTVQVWVEAKNPGERLRAGVPVKIGAVAQTIKDAILIPQTALLRNAEGETVVMVVTSDMVAHERKVEVGVKQGDKAQVASGLKEGEQVVTVGGVGLDEGKKVRIDTGKGGDEDKGKGDKKDDKDDKDDKK
jgi:HlyD family secretion protein